MTNQDNKKDSHSDEEIEEILEESQEKEKKSKIDLSININRFSFIFYFLFVGLIGYLIIAAMIPLQPFYLSGTPLPDTLELNEGLFIVLVITSLVFLMVGLYFNWFWKGKRKEKLAETLDDHTENEGIIFSSVEQNDEILIEKEDQNN